MPHEEVPLRPPEPWASFLKTLDDLLDQEVALHCIGGFAVTMRYGLSRTTADIDVLAATQSHELAELQRLAGQGSALHKRFKVYVQPVTVASYPENYAERIVPIFPAFKLPHLKLFALEAHDLALTKLERNLDIDRQDVLELADAGYLDPETLRERYLSEFRPNLPAGVERHDLTLNLWMEMCWPERSG
jgi:hypothetical protein